MKPAGRTAQPRNAALAQIHLGKKALSMDDDTYRAMLWAQARVKSAADLDHVGRAKVLAYMRGQGAFKDRADKTAGRPPNPAPDRQPQLKKIEALLADAGRPWAYVDSMCKRICKVDAIQFATPEHLQQLIAALTYDQKRRAKAAEKTKETA